MSDSDDPAQVSNRAAQLREAFDRAFAEAPRAAEGAMVELLAIRIAAMRCAIRLSDIRGIFPDKRITPVPSRRDELIGVASFRGAVIPVYGLQALLGVPGGTNPRWLVIAAAGNVALAFDELESHLRVAPASLESAGGGQRTTKHIESFLRIDGFVRGVIHVPSLMAAIGMQAAKRD